MSTLIILTNSFPYEGGEQFIEEEIKFWGNTKFDKVFLLPNRKSKKIRSFPSNIGLLTSKNKKLNFFYALKSLFNPIFYKELIYISKSYPFVFGSIYIAWKNMAIIIQKKNEINSCLEEVKDSEIFIYSYWNEAATYAACLLKLQGKVTKVFSRAHGFDLYENRRDSGYMPYKRQFVKYMDKVFLLSKGALDYYEKIYGAKKEQLEVARLGVKQNSCKGDNKREKLLSNTLNLLTVSYCVHVKQIDKIMAGVLNFSRENSSFKVKWVHIGSGYLFETLKLEADKLSNNEKNLFIEFVGSKTNAEVHEFLNKNETDIFINGSSSEGIPVSIMEAMSYGVPAIAPDVGGIADLVNEDNGVLLPADYNVADLSEAIRSLTSRENRVKKSNNARLWVEQYFNSDKNYKMFIERLQDECDV